MKSTSWFLFVISLSAVACVTQSIAQSQAAASQQHAKHLWPVSMIQLIANPEKYDSVYVSVEGYCHWRDENVALYLSKEDADYLRAANALWLRFSDSVRKFPLSITGAKDTTVDISYFDGKHIMVSGVFDKTERGNGLYAGGLISVDRIYEDRQWYNGGRVLWRLGADGKVLQYFGP